MKRLHKSHIPESCVFYERGGIDGLWTFKYAKLIPRKTKNSEYIIE